MAPMLLLTEDELKKESTDVSAKKHLCRVFRNTVVLEDLGLWRLDAGIFVHKSKKRKKRHKKKVKSKNEGVDR